jgi:glycosyltransferase involved in cell wall biosynthesis
MSRSCLFHLSANQYPPFPAQHHTRRIWEELSQGFDEYHVIARGEGRRYVHSVDGRMHLHLLPACGRSPSAFFLLSWALPWFVLRYRPTHLLAQCPVQGGLAAAACAKAFGLPLFVEVHGAHYFGRERRGGWRGPVEFAAYRALSPVAFKVARRVRSLSEDMSEQLVATYGAELREKIVTIPTRVDLSRFASAKESYRVDGPIRLVTVGSCAPRKNHLSLIRDLARSSVPFELTIVGSGPLEGEYRRVAAEVGVAGQVHVTGQVEHRQLAGILAGSDAYVHYSRSEGLARAILEAMAVGLPVVATRVGFVKGVLEDGANALLLDPPWERALGTALERLTSSEELRRALGTAARTTIVTRFEWNAVFTKYREELLAMEDGHG